MTVSVIRCDCNSYAGVANQMSRTYYGKVTCGKHGVTVKKVKACGPRKTKRKRRSRRKHGITWIK